MTAMYRMVILLLLLPFISAAQNKESKDTCDHNSDYDQFSNVKTISVGGKKFNGKKVHISFLKYEQQNGNFRYVILTGKGKDSISARQEAIISFADGTEFRKPDQELRQYKSKDHMDYYLRLEVTWEELQMISQKVIKTYSFTNVKRNLPRDVGTIVHTRARCFLKY